VRRLERAILLTSVLAVLAAVSISAAWRISRPFPLSPWESVIVRDAWRLTQGSTVYQPAADGPATHMYGPVVTWANAALFTAFQPNLWTPRLLSLLAVAATLTVLGGFVWRSTRDRTATLLTVTLVLADAMRCRAIYAETRPDALAAALGFAGLFLALRSRWWAVPAFVLAAWSKQPAVAFAVAAVVAGLVMRQKSTLTIGGVALLAIATSAVVMKLAMPDLWRHAVVAPGLWPMRWRTGPDVAILYALIVPVFWTGIVAHLTRGARVDRTILGLAVAAFVLLAAGWLGQVKDGGAINSAWPGLALCSTLAALCWHRIDLDRPGVRTVLAGLVLLHAAAVPKAAVWATDRARHGDGTYSQVIAEVAALPGTVASPDDPALLVFAHRPEAATARSFDAERDVTYLAKPPQIEAELDRADWVVRVHATWDAHLNDEDLKTLGFERVRNDWSTMYSLWRRR
jgi:hypothetical protein